MGEVVRLRIYFDRGASWFCWLIENDVKGRGVKHKSKVMLHRSCVSEPVCSGGVLRMLEFINYD